MDKVAKWVVSIWIVVLTVLFVAQVTVNKQQQATISALGHAYETCQRYNAIANCNLEGLKDCEEKVKKAEQQTMDFVRRLEVK